VVEVLKLNTLKSLRSHGGVDRALLSFDLKVDLTPAFHWNIKQIFVYVVAVYETDGSGGADGMTTSAHAKSKPPGTKQRRINQVVLWDKIVEATDANKVIDQTNVFVKYALIDQGAELRGKKVNLQLQWDHMPLTGLVHKVEQDMANTTSFILPEEYV
jgi:signal peptidase complex subunit 3